MASENVEIVRRLLEAFDRRDNEFPFTVYDEQIVWDVIGFEMVDAAVFHGHEGVRSFWRQWLGAWERVEFEVREIIDAGDTVVSVLCQRNRGRHSGIEVEMGPYALVWTLRNGKVVRMRAFGSAAQGLAAAGVAR